MYGSQRKAAKQQRAVERWRQSDVTQAARPVRIRARHLAGEADALSQNAWDDVQLGDEYTADAERIIAAQQFATADKVDGCIQQAAARWDQHYVENLRNYHDRNYLQNEFPSLLSDVRRASAARRELVVLETGCGVGNTLLPLTALDPCVRVVGCDHAPKAVAMANQR